MILAMMTTANPSAGLKMLRIGSCQTLTLEKEKKNEANLQKSSCQLQHI